MRSSPEIMNGAASIDECISSSVSCPAGQSIDDVARTLIRKQGDGAMKRKWTGCAFPGLVVATPVIAQILNADVLLRDASRDERHYATVVRGWITEELSPSGPALGAARAGEPLPDGTVSRWTTFATVRSTGSWSWRSDPGGQTDRTPADGYFADFLPTELRPLARMARAASPAMYRKSRTTMPSRMTG
jgi:hypothetical protein